MKTVNLIAETDNGIEYLVEMCENVWVDELLTHAQYLIRERYGHDVTVDVIKRSRFV